MAKTNVLDRSTTREILREVAQRNQSLDLVRQLGDDKDVCRSRFAQVPEHELAIEVPSRRGHPVPVRPGERIEAYFRLKERRYWFASVVESRTFLKLSADLSLPVLILKPPRSIELRQRREHYRVRLRATDRLMAGLWRAADSPDAASPARLPPMEVLDFSAGGMRLVYARREGCPANEGDVLTVSLPLEPGQPPARLTARVLRVSRAAEGVTHVGSEFVGLDDSPEGRMLRDRLGRFVTRREREELQRMSTRPEDQR